MDKPLKSVTHGQCYARPTVTFPAAGHHRPFTGTKLYCLVTGAHACEQLAQGCHLKAERPRLEPGGQPTPFAPMYILYAHRSRAYKMIPVLMNMGRTQVCCVNTDTSVYGRSTRVVCTNPDMRRLRREYQRVLSVCHTHE